MDISLPQKRNDLARRMVTYRSLPEYILDGIGALSQRLITPAARSRVTFLPVNVSEQEVGGCQLRPRMSGKVPTIVNVQTRQHANVRTFLQTANSRQLIAES